MSLRTLDLNLLKVFNEVMSERSLTKAAQKLAMTQPAVSNAIGRLREALGDDLVVRSGYGVQPTARATALWPVVREALTSLEQVISPGEFDPAQATHSFRLAMADATATAIVPALVSIIEQEAPGVSLRILPLTTRDPRQLLESGRADVAIGYFPVAGPAIRLHSMQDDAADQFGVAPLYQGPYVCIMRKDHPLAGTARLTLDQFCSAHHLLVSFSGRPFGFADQSLAELGRKRRILLTVNQFFTAGLVVVKSDLLAVMPKHFIRSTGFEDQFAVRSLPFKMDLASIDAIWTDSAEAEPAHQWLIGALKRAINVSDDELLTRA
ncbi:MAG: LysR family transcriptional regulator [Burkholderiaceae bacterium]